MNGVPRIPATRDAIGRMIRAVGYEGVPGGDYSTRERSVYTERAKFAKEMCQILRRSTTPDTNGQLTPVFPDISSPLIHEVSIWHNYVLTNDGNEIWTLSDQSKDVDI